MRHMNLRSLFATMALGLAPLTFGCGGPATSLDGCYAACDALFRCGVLSEVNTTNCKNNCTKDAGKHSDEDRKLAEQCSNSADIRSKQIACYGAPSACNAVSLAQCLATASQCVFK